MRKRNFSYFFDKIFWGLIVLLPIFILLLSWYRLGTTEVTLSSVLTDMGVTDTNVVYTTMQSIFGTGSDGIGLFTGSDIYLFASYFVGVELLHLFIDFLVFIPRICHKFMHKFTREE